MINQILAYIGAGLSTLWGVAHLFPTKNVVADFGDISEDNRHIITMEWIVEGVALIFIGVLVATVTAVDAASPVTRAVYWLTVVGLNVLSVVSLFTGVKVNFIMFKLCPVIFTGASILILLGILL
jgi:hypothetical protein